MMMMMMMIIEGTKFFIRFIYKNSLNVITPSRPTFSFPLAVFFLKTKYLCHHRELEVSAAAEGATESTNTASSSMYAPCL